MRDARPWGFDPQLELLEPGKIVTDPVHGDIYLNKLELLVINSRPFQRLRRVRQLGMTPEVYPGATNTRFAHSLGELRSTPGARRCAASESPATPRARTRVGGVGWTAASIGCSSAGAPARLPRRVTASTRASTSSR